MMKPVKPGPLLPQAGLFDWNIDPHAFNIGDGKNWHDHFARTLGITALYLAAAAVTIRSILVRSLAPKLPADPEAFVLQDLFGGSAEANKAWQGLKKGWGIERFEQELGPEGMVLLLREQKVSTESILALRWRRGPAPINFTKIWNEACEDYASIRTKHPRLRIISLFRGFPWGHFESAGRRFCLAPFVAFRHYAGPETSLFHYYDLPELVVVKWPRALIVDTEALNPDMLRINERLVLGGVPSRFVVFRGARTTTAQAVQVAGGPEAFFRTL